MHAQRLERRTNNSSNKNPSSKKNSFTHQDRNKNKMPKFFHRKIFNIPNLRNETI